MEQKYTLSDLLDAVHDTVAMLEQMGYPSYSSLDFTVVIRQKQGKPVIVAEFPTVKV